MSVIEVLEELEGTSSRLGKERILRGVSNDELLKRVLVAAEDPYRVYFVSKFSMPSGRPLVEPPDEKALEMFVDHLLPLLERGALVGNEARKRIEGALAGMGPGARKWAQRIVLKNLRIGASSATINRVWPGLIPGFSVQLAHKVEAIIEGRKIKVLTPLRYPVRVEPKLDGFRLIALKEGGRVSLRTRNGNELSHLVDLQRVLAEAPYDDFMLDGELFGTSLNVSASVALSSVSRKDESLVGYHTFDAMPIADWKRQKCDFPYTERRKLVSRLVLEVIKSDRVFLVPGRDVESDEELIEAYHEHLDEGFEGGMVKKLDGAYAFKRSDDILKMKPYASYEGRVVGHYQGKTNTRNEGLFGGFRVRLPSGVVTKVGTGFTDKLVDEINSNGPDTFIGRVLEVEGQELTEDGKVRHPRFIRWRDPRDVDPSVLEE